MKFRNVSGDELLITFDGQPHLIAPGETTPDLDEDQAAGLIGQVPNWVAVGAEARKEQAAVVAETQPTEQEK